MEDGAWVAAQVFVGPGVTIGAEAVASAGSIVTKSLPAGMVCAGNPCSALKPRWAAGASNLIPFEKQSSGCRYSSKDRLPNSGSA